MSSIVRRLRESIAHQRSELFASSLLVIVIRVTNILVVFGLSVFLLRTLGLREFGLFATYQATMALAVLPMTAGLPTLVVRETAFAFEQDDLAHVRGTLSAVLKIVIGYLVLVALLLMAATQWLPEWLSPSLQILLWMHVALQILAAVRSAVLRAAGQVVRGQLIERLYQPVLTILFNIAAFWMLDAAFSLMATVCALLLANLVTLLLGVFSVKRHALPAGPSVPVDVRSIARDGFRISGAGILSSVFLNGIVIATTTLASAEATGIYRIASAIAQPLLFVHEATGQVAAPKLARLARSEDRSATTRLLSIAVAASVTVTAAGLLGLALLGQPAIELAYGAEARGAWTIAMVIAIAHLANAAGGLDQELLYMSGFTTEVFTVNAVVVPLVLAGTLLTLPSHGAMAAAWALVFYHVASTIWISKAAIRATGFNPSITSAIFR